MTRDLSHLDEHRGYIGSSGSGKSTTAKLDVEELLRQGRHTAIIDVTGVWWGLRSSADGRGPGFDIPIFGGRKGDVAIAAGDGEAIGRLVADGVSAIVDLVGLRSGPELRQFMADFIGALRRKPRGHFQLICDEADEYVPEKGGIRDAAHLQVAEDMIWMAKRGRTDGYVLSLLTQRLADVANAAFSQVKTIFAHNLIQPDDQTAFGKYVKGKGTKAEFAEIMGGLASLQVGQRYLYRPRLHILELGTTELPETFDSMQTPAAGEVRHEPKMLSQIDVTAIAAALKKPSAEAPIASFDAGAEAGRLLLAKDARIRELEGRVDELEALLPSYQDFVRIYQAALDDAVRILSEARKTPAPGAQIEHAGSAREESSPALLPHAGGGKAGARGRRSLGEIAEAAFPNSTEGAEGAAAPDREYRALAVLAAAAPLGLTEAAWAARGGYSRRGGAWARRRKRYLDAGLIEQRGEGRERKWFATEAGLAQAGEEPLEFPAPGPELVAFWARRLGAPGRILQILAGLYPRTLTRGAIAEEAGMSPKGGAFNRHMTALKSAELVIERGKRIGVAPAVMGGE